MAQAAQSGVLNGARGGALCSRKGAPPALRGATTMVAARRSRALVTRAVISGGERIENLSQVVVPEDLITIRAYVRWEEAGKPEDTTPEWQAAEFAKARLDLQLELLQGTSLNDIRRRYNQGTIDGDDEPKYKDVDISKLLMAGLRDRAPLEASKSSGGGGGGGGGGQGSDQSNDVASAAAAAGAAPTPLDVGEADKEEAAGETEIEPEEWLDEEPEHVGEFHSDKPPRDLRPLIMASSSVEACEDEVCNQAATFMARWAGSSPTPLNALQLINQRLYPVGKGSELLVQMYHIEEQDSEAVSGPRKKVSKRRVVFTTDKPDPLVLHWGVARDEPGQWLLPPKALWPADTEAVSEMSVETPLVPSQGCLIPQVEDSIDEECYPIQTLAVDLPGEGADELMGLQFVLRNEEGTAWFKDTTNGNSNFRANYSATGSSSRASCELLDTIIRAEAGGGWWTLMHRFNLASSLLEKECAPGINNRSAAADIAAASKIFVWLRYSSQRKLTWQRNYNVKPRELSGAQSKLTRVIAGLYSSVPHLRDVTRLMLGTVGKGGEGGQGQQIRDEILNIMHRNNIKESKGIWIEEWHQKLHNNTTPDDIVICEAYIAFLKSDMNLDEYWRVLGEGGVTRERLESFERPIRQEPTPRPAIKVALIKDFLNYLKILKSVHSGADLIDCIKACSKGLGGVSDALNYVRVAQNGGGDALQLLAACVEARHELRDAGLAQASDPTWTRELLYLDLAIDDVSRRAVERAGEADYGVEEQMRLAGLVTENLALSLPCSNQDIVLALTEWRRVEQSRRDGDPQWALRAKAVVDRIRLAVALHADAVAADMQGAATDIGEACGIESWAVDVFAEEVIRGGPAFALSLVLSRLDPALRAEADMGAWQIISPFPASGVVKHVMTLRSVMNQTFDKPTVLVADKVGGDEEIPAGAVAVLTTCSVDVLSHSAVRARNGGVLFATCYDDAALKAIADAAGSAVKITVKGDDVLWEEVDAASLELDGGGEGKGGEGAGAGAAGGGKKRGSMPKGLSLEKIPFCGKFSVPLEEFEAGVVGAKARNTKALHESLGGGKIPDWIRLPKSMVVPFGTMEHILKDPINKSVAEELAELELAVDDSSEDTLEATLKACRSCVRTILPPDEMLDEIEDAMLDAGIEPPEDEERWTSAWAALAAVWASKWNNRAFVSLRNAGINHGDLRMSVLVQPVVDADYAFVIHTVNPSSNDETELYAEVVMGLGEVLVGNFPGRALSFAVKKASPKEAASGKKYLAAGETPRVLGFPSKSVLLKIPRPTIIFRSDSNGEDLDGYAGAGLYESVPMDKEQTLHADYSADPLVWDHEFQANMLTKIAEAGVAIEAALNGVPQDIEGVVKGGEIYVVQTRPQV